MKTSKNIARALLVFGIAAFVGFGFVSPVGKVMAEGVAQAVEAVAIQASAASSADRQCEQREVEADEGYGISRKEIRIVCH
jgi:hypothetical protein